MTPRPTIIGLAIETSSRFGSVALAEDGRTIAAASFEHGLQNAARIIPAIDELCRQRSLRPGDLRHIYVSTGPGSFTGLRIGITLAKTLAFTTGAELVAVPTAEVLVQNTPAEARHVVLVLDAKRGQIFTATYERGGRSPSPGLRRAQSSRTPGEGWGGGLSGRQPCEEPPPSPSPGIPEEGITPWIEREPARLDRLADVLARSRRPVHLLGEGIPYHQQFIDAQDAGIIITDAALWRPRASIVAQLGWEKSLRCEFTDPLRLTPVYIRRPEAEEKRLAAFIPSSGTPGEG